MKRFINEIEIVAIRRAWKLCPGLNRFMVPVIAIYTQNFSEEDR
jgi:hypothetical protein